MVILQHDANCDDSLLFDRRLSYIVAAVLQWRALINMLRCYVARGTSRTAYGIAVIGSILLPLDFVPSIAPTFAPAGVYMALYDWLHSNMKRVSENLQSQILRRHRLVNVLFQEGVHPAVAALTSGDLSPAITCFFGCLDCCP